MSGTALAYASRMSESAKDNMGVLNTPDPYVVICIGEQTFRSTTRYCPLSPTRPIGLGLVGERYVPRPPRAEKGRVRGFENRFKTRDPVWNETIRFVLPRGHQYQTVRFSLHDRDLLSS
eukprot:2732672-Rhodomonas_salina.1